MTGPLLYPPADHATQWVGKGSVTMPMDHVKWLQHTTETAGGWPSYSYGGVQMGSAPTLTYEPWQHKWRQHFEINQSARALQNDGSFYTNRCDVVQTEISCYCDHSLSGKYGHSVNDLDDQAINDLGDFGAWLVAEWGMKADSFYPATLPWGAYPKGCTRMTTTAFAAFSGIVGHMAAPGNDHLDPGDLDNTAVKARMDQLAQPPQGDEFDMATLADLETAIKTVKFTIDVAGKPTELSLENVIAGIEKEQDYNRDQLARTLAALTEIKAAIAALPH